MDIYGVIAVAVGILFILAAVFDWEFVFKDHRFSRPFERIVAAVCGVMFIAVCLYYRL